MLEIGSNLNESLDEPRVNALEPLSAKPKRQTRSEKKLLILSRVNCTKVSRSSRPGDHHRSISIKPLNVGNTKLPIFNEATFRFPSELGTHLGQIKISGTGK